MIDELDKYRVEIFKIAGFAMMTPLGRIFVQPTVVFNEFKPVWFFIYLLISFGLGTIGFMLILKGSDILYGERKNKEGKPAR